MKAESICIIGAGLWQKPYLMRAQELGYRVIACDWSSDAEGRSFADVFGRIDVKDKEGVLKFAKDHSVNAVLTAADVGVPTAAYVANELNLPYHTEILAHQATNKIAMRIKATELNIPIPKFRAVEINGDFGKYAAEIGYPIICKPADNCSSRGVVVVNNKSELLNACDLAIENTHDNRILLEELMYGTEGSVEAICSDRKITVLGICNKIKSPLPYRYDLQLNYPGKFNNNEFKAIEKLLRDVVVGYEIVNGIVHLEFIIQNGKPKLIEFALRGCGSNVITHLIPALTDFDPVSYLIHQSFGINDMLVLKEGKVGVLYFIILQEGKIQSIEGVGEIMNSKNVVDFMIEKQPGDFVKLAKDGRSRPGHIIAVADNIDDLDAEITKLQSCLKVEYDTI